MKPAAGYFRVSQARDDMKAPELYEDEIRRYCSYKELELGAVYSDIDRSGYGKASGNRPALKELLTRRHEFGAVIVPKLSRFGRSLAHLTELFETFDSDGIDLVFLDVGIDTSTSQGRLLRNIMAAFAEFESDVRSDYARANYRHVVSSGGVWGGQAPYGYRRDGHRYVVVAEEAERVREIFERHLAGETQAAIAKSFNECGVPKSHPTPWTISYVGRILDNPAYAALVLLDGELIAARWEAIIARDTWEQLRTKRERHLGYFRDKRAATRGPYLLTGMFFCGVCGAPMYHTFRARRPSGSYRCREASAGRGCPGGSIAEHSAEAQVRDAFLARCSFGGGGLEASLDPRARWEAAPPAEKRKLLALTIDRVVLVPWGDEVRNHSRAVEVAWKKGFEDSDQAAMVLEATARMPVVRPIRESRADGARKDIARLDASKKAARSEARRSYFREWRAHLERVREGAWEQAGGNREILGSVRRTVGSQ